MRTARAITTWQFEINELFTSIPPSEFAKQRFLHYLSRLPVAMRTNILAVCVNRAIHAKSLETLIFLQECKASFHYELNSKTPLYVAATLNAEEIVGWLLKQNISQKASGTLCSPPILLSGYHGNIEMAQLFLDHGATLEACNNEGNTVLHIALAAKKTQMAIWLIVEKNIPLTLLNEKGLDFLSNALICDEMEIAELLVSRGMSLEKNHEKILVWLLLYNKSSAILWLVRKGFPLQKHSLLQNYFNACIQQNYSPDVVFICWLIWQGALPLETTDKKLIAFCKKHNLYDIIEFFSTLDITEKNKYILFFAIMDGNIEFVKRLLGESPLHLLRKVAISHNELLTPIDYAWLRYARNNTGVDILSCLLEEGAGINVTIKELTAPSDKLATITENQFIFGYIGGKQIVSTMLGFKDAITNSTDLQRALNNPLRKEVVLLRLSKLFASYQMFLSEFPDQSLNPPLIKLLTKYCFSSVPAFYAPPAVNLDHKGKRHTKRRNFIAHTVITSAGNVSSLSQDEDITTFSTKLKALENKVQSLEAHPAFQRAKALYSLGQPFLQKKNVSKFIRPLQKMILSFADLNERFKTLHTSLRQLQDNAKEETENTIENAHDVKKYIAEIKVLDVEAEHLSSTIELELENQNSKLEKNLKLYMDTPNPSLPTVDASHPSVTPISTDACLIESEPVVDEVQEESEQQEMPSSTFEVVSAENTSQPDLRREGKLGGKYRDRFKSKLKEAVVRDKEKGKERISEENTQNTEIKHFTNNTPTIFQACASIQPHLALQRATYYLSRIQNWEKTLIRYVEAGISCKILGNICLFYHVKQFVIAVQHLIESNQSDVKLDIQPEIKSDIRSFRNGICHHVSELYIQQPQLLIAFKNKLEEESHHFNLKLPNYYIRLLLSCIRHEAGKQLIEYFSAQERTIVLTDVGKVANILSIILSHLDFLINFVKKFIPQDVSDESTKLIDLFNDEHHADLYEIILMTLDTIGESYQQLEKEKFAVENTSIYELKPCHQLRNKLSHTPDAIAGIQSLVSLILPCLDKYHQIVSLYYDELIQQLTIQKIPILRLG